MSSTAVLALIDTLPEMQAQLRAHDEVHLIRSFIGAAASPTAIAAARQQWKLPEPLLSLYQRANGISIVWTLGDLDYWEDEMLPAFSDGHCSYDDIVDWDAGVIGALVVPPLETLAEASEAITLEPADLADSPTVSNFSQAVPFDTYFFFNAAVAVFATNGPPRVVIGDDHCAAWSDFPSLTVPDYLSLVTQTWCTIVGRRQVAGINQLADGDLDAASLPKWTLNEAIEAARDDWD